MEKLIIYKKQIITTTIIIVISVICFGVYILHTTLNNATAICKILDFNFTNSKLKNFTNTFSTHRCDPFDYVILDNCVSTSHTNIISDDNDFTTFSGINLYTANVQSLADH